MTQAVDNPELNYYPLDITSGISNSVESTAEDPQVNTAAAATTDSNVIPTGGGTVMNLGKLQSANFVQGALGSGWRIDSNGDVEFNNGNFRGDISGATGHFTGTVDVHSLNIPDAVSVNSFHVDASGNIWSGAVTFDMATNSFAVSAAGSARIRDAIIGGWTVGATTIISAGIILDSGNNDIHSSNYVLGVSGFKISPTLIEAENINARGTLRGSTFKYDVISAVGGQLIIANADTLASDMTALDSSTLTIKGDVVFAVNDILVLRAVTALGIQEEWLRVTSIASAPTYAVTRDLAGSFAPNTNPIWQAGTPVSVQGSSDGASVYSGGWLRLLGAGTNSPYYSVFARTGIAYNTYAERCRLGNLNGIGGKVADTYGIFIGDYANLKYLMYDDVSNDFIISSQKIVQPFTAGFALTAGQAVSIYTDGKVYPTNAEVNTALSFLGFCLTTTAKDALAPIQVFGNFTGLSGLSLTNIPPIYYLSNGTHTKDQENTTGATEVSQTQYWQSFTSGSGITSISKITFFLRNSTPGDKTATATIKTGEGTGGTQVGTSKTITIGGGEAVGVNRDFIFDVPITITASTQYTIIIDVSSANISAMDDNGAASYAGGRGDRGANYDYRFATYKINAYGTIGTSAGTVSKKVGLATSATSLTLKDSI